MTERTPDAGKTMTDREMLELAAKAAGIPVYESTDGTIQNRPILVFMGTMPYEMKWDPRIDDAQVFRLAVKLKIDVKHYDDHVVGWFDGGYIGTVKIMYGKDPYAATRFAITRAASEVGRAMKGGV